MIKLSQLHKDALRMMISRKEFPAFTDYLKVQINNIGVIEWSRTDSLDPLLSVKKAKFEGKIEGLRELLTLFEMIGKETKEEDEEPT
jgi:hypothetical protein